jgi:hypothetical protein
VERYICGGREGGVINRQGVAAKFECAGVGKYRIFEFYPLRQGPELDRPAELGPTHPEAPAVWAHQSATEGGIKVTGFEPIVQSYKFRAMETCESEFG